MAAAASGGFCKSDGEGDAAGPPTDREGELDEGEKGEGAGEDVAVGAGVATGGQMPEATGRWSQVGQGRACGGGRRRSGWT